MGRQQATLDASDMLRSVEHKGHCMGIGSAFSVASTTTRHMLDANVTFGMSSDRYNARDKYRRNYSDAQRTGAGVGTALGVALPATAGLAWMQRGMQVPGAAKFTTAGRAAGVVALGLATAVGVKKTVEITKDDGHFGAVGTASGVVGGTLAGIWLGQKFAGKYAPLVSGAGAIIGGIAGHMGGSRVNIGESQIGKAHAQAPNDDMHEVPLTDIKIDGATGRAISFAQGGINHFNEIGPTSQGVSFGHAWGMRESVQKQYSNSERAGAMHGDLLAVGIAGGGALAVASGLAGRSNASLAGVSNLKAGSDIAGRMLSRGPVTGAIQKLGEKGALGVGAAAVGIAGVVALKEWDRAKDSTGDSVTAGMYAGGVLAATAGTAALVSRSSTMSGMAAAPKAASSLLVAAALIGVLSSARMPLQQFMNDASDAHAANGKIDKPVAIAASGLGAVGGVIGSSRILSKLVPDSGLQLGKFRIPKGIVVAAGTAIGGAAVGGMGYGLSATMPDIKTVGLSMAGGAAAGAALGGMARGIGVVPGIIGGAALGMSASALLQGDAPEATQAPTPQEVVGAAS